MIRRRTRGSIRLKCAGGIGNLRSFGLCERARTPNESCLLSALLVMEQSLGGRGLGRRLGVLGGALLLERFSGLLGHGLSRRLIRHRGPLDRGGLVGPDSP